MAKQSSAITVTGKLGNIVGMKGRNGRSNARIRVTPKNPKSYKQSVQRIIFGTVIKDYSFLRSITDHSFEGVSYGQRSQEKFMSLNLDKARSVAAAELNGENLAGQNKIAFWGGSDEARYFNKGVGCIIAKGSLDEVSPYYSGESDSLAGFGPGMESETIADIMENFGLKAGDQLTIVAVTMVNGSMRLDKSRYVLKSELSEEDLLLGWPQTSSLNAAFDSEKSLIGNIHTTFAEEGDEDKVYRMDIVENEDSGEIYGKAIIISRETTDGWLRSDATIWPCVEVAEPQLGIAEAIAMYTTGSAAIEDPDAKYLNNAENLGE